MQFLKLYKKIPKVHSKHSDSANKLKAQTKIDFAKAGTSRTGVPSNANEQDQKI